MNWTESFIRELGSHTSTDLSDVMLRVAFWVTNPCRFTRNVVSNETNEDVRMYIEEYLF